MSSTRFENGQSAKVEDGHLTVLGFDGSRFNKVLGVYVPGKWVAFTVEGEAAQVDNDS